jgi:glycosyltransferase involved in cell wall biosynthesis
MGIFDPENVLILSTGSGIGGMERVVLSLAQGCAERAVRARVVVPAANESEKTRAWFREHGIESETSDVLKNAFGRRRLTDVPALRRFIAASPAPVVNLHYCMGFPSLNDVLAVRLAGKRCVVSLHVAPANTTPERARKTRAATALCDTVVAVSGYLGQQLIAGGVPAEKVRIIRCAVPIPPQSDARRRAARRRFGIAAESFVVSAVARLDRQKSVSDLVEALGRISDRARTTDLLVVGEGPERDTLQALADRLLPGRCRFFGHVTDPGELSDIYRASDLFALPSRNETFGLVYAEAAAHGLATIGCAVGGVPETILDGETGILTPSGDVGALGAAISRLRSDAPLRERMGRAGRLRAAQEFSLGRMAGDYLEFLLPDRNARYRSASVGQPSLP